MGKLSLGDLWIQLCLSSSQTQPLATPVYSSERLFRLAMQFLVLQFYLIPQEQISLRQTWLHGWWYSSGAAGLVVQLSGFRADGAAQWLHGY